MDHQSNIGRLDETEVHDWYRHVYAYSDRIIADLADDWGIDGDDLLLDPFNGTGTTTVAAKKLGIDCVGTDVNPVGILAGRAKTQWDVDVEAFRKRRDALLATAEPPLREISGQGHTTLSSFATGGRDEANLSRYDFSRSPKLPKGWLSEKPHKKMRVLKHHIDAEPDDAIADLFQLAMVAILPEEVANVGFGPEAYRTEPQDDVDVYRAFRLKLEKMEHDLRRVQRFREHEGVTLGRTEVLRADAREVGDVLATGSELLAEHGGIDYVITSPPYPAEHDYTRNQRLELVWMDAVWDNDDLRDLKQHNVRSHSKNIYADDDAGERLSIRDNDRIDEIVSEMEAKADAKEDISGFEETYSRVVEEYFSNMQEHLTSVYGVLSPGAKCGYVVSEQQSYWNVRINTAEIIGELAEDRIGYRIDEIRKWRTIHSTTGESDELSEDILILERPESATHG